MIMASSSSCSCSLPFFVFLNYSNLTSMDITNLTSMDIADNNNNVPSVLGRQTKWEDLFFYQKADVIYQLSFVFCDRFIHLYKDRTRDQVIQAARSCKQNIVEGLADGVTSSEMQLKLLNVARASLKELREDFEDYLKSRHREFYVAGEERYDVMLDYCSRHNKLKDYEPFFQTWSDEQMCNYALTLCHMIDRMMMSFLKRLEREFVTEGGIKERMHKARTGYRQQQDARLKQLEAELPVIRKELDEARAAAEKWKAAYEDLKQRALKAYYKQQEEIKRLKDLLGEEGL